MRLNDELAALGASSFKAGKLSAAVKDEGLPDQENMVRPEISSSEVSGYLRSVHDSTSEHQSSDLTNGGPRARW